ncbi:MAG: GHMP kinase, partial [Verrucomicrobiota bacterium]
RARFDRGDSEVVEAMAFWAELTEKTRELLTTGKGEMIGSLLNQNFDKRREIYQVSEGNLRMIETARSVGASAKFTGSGGAIVGTYENAGMFRKLKDKLEPLGMRVIRPVIEPSAPEPFES